ncbi:hypothetical protein Q5H93_02225 [Hymenobacter sp. ASUV-10]|uniref:DUF4268 domain-containing protein n=1 Tax=Hymenobacter aranciens TaxID=3063996 RepID=A0ABT9B5I6_9BACT|nr:hypothetical protein [Hymenobacter sp. ASUV-10]MDO7873532.1 hypothetical protein [Hymenobacter sp. ASUV-10]
MKRPQEIAFPAAINSHEHVQIRLQLDGAIAEAEEIDEANRFNHGREDRRKPLAHCWHASETRASSESVGRWAEFVRRWAARAPALGAAYAASQA